LDLRVVQAGLVVMGAYTASMLEFSASSLSFRLPIEAVGIPRSSLQPSLLLLRLCA